MDEPTSSLGYEETRSLMDLIRRLKSQGIGIIYISHYLEEIFEIGDRVLVLKDGEYVGTYNREEVDPDLADVVCRRFRTHRRKCWSQSNPSANYQSLV